MALISCKECNNQVSSNAYNCPSCGASLRKPQRGVFGQVAKWAFIGFNLLMMLWLISSVSILQQGSSDPETQSAANIGTGAVTFVILIIWVLGDIVLGALTFFTRAKR